MADKFLDLDALIPDPQIITLKGREFDVSKATAADAVKLFKVAGNTAGKGYSDNPSGAFDLFEEEFKALIPLLGNDQNGEPASYDWLIENVNINQLQMIATFVGECISGIEDEQVAPGETPADFTKPVGNRQQRRAKAKK